jgi:hypothetical protein
VFSRVIVGSFFLKLTQPRMKPIGTEVAEPVTALKNNARGGVVLVDGSDEDQDFMRTSPQLSPVGSLSRWERPFSSRTLHNDDALRLHRIE